METKKFSTRIILEVLYWASWIIFVGLCIQAGAFLTNAAFALFKPEIVSRLWQQVDLKNLFNYDTGYFFVITFVMGIVAVMKALMFYLIIKMLSNKNLNLTKPFSENVRRFIFLLFYLALGIGLFSTSGIKFLEWLAEKGVRIADTQYLGFGGSDVWLFMATIFFVIAQVFKRGIEIQSENELTI